MQNLAASLRRLPEGLEVRAVTIESSAGAQSVTLPLGPDSTLPPVEGPFTITIDFAPNQA